MGMLGTHRGSKAIGKPEVVVITGGSAGTVPYLMEVLLGLMPEAFDQRLRVIRPMLPDFIDRVEV